MNYLALGDSYTIGEALPEKESFPFLLRQELLKHYKEVNLTVIAQTGWTAQELQKAIPFEQLKNTHFDIITLLIGANNQYRGQSLEQFQLEFHELVKHVNGLIHGQTKVVVLSIPNYANTPFVKSNQDFISASIAAYNHFLKQEAKKKSWTYLDNTHFDHEVLLNSQLLASDQLHYSTLYYAKWVQNMVKYLFAF